MKTVLNFDRVVLIKELNDKIKKIGDTFEIANILDNSFLLREARSKIAVGVVSFEDFDKHFVAEENYKGWTDWQSFVGFDGQNDVVYRSNRRRVQVKFLKNNIKAEACCCKDDDFNLSFGIQLAYLRCLTKAMCKKADKLQEEVYKLDKEIFNNMEAERKMLSSLK